MIYKMTLADSADSMTFDLLEVPIADKDVEGAVDNTLVNGNVFTDYLWLKKQWTQKWALMCDDEYTQLRGFYTRQWENAEAPTYRLFYGDNIDTYDTQSGDYILVNIDAPLGAEMSLTQLDGNATQTSKNLFDPSNLPSSWSATAVATISLSLQPNTTYTFSSTIPKNTFGNADMFFYASGTTPSTSNEGVWSGQSRTLTTGPTGNNLIVGYRSQAGSAITRDDYTYQLEKGATATSFEGFSPTPSTPVPIETVTGGQTVSVVGKNLFTNDIYNQLDLTGNAQLQSDGYYKIEFPSNRTIMEGEFQPNTQYTISASAYGGASGNNGVLGFNYTDGTSETKGINQTTAYNYTITSTAGKTIKNIKITYGSQKTTYIKNLQLELGSTATAYEPYQGQSYEVNLGKNLFDKDNATTINNLYIDSAGAVATGDGNRFTYVELNPNTTYTLTQGVKGGTNIRIALFSQTPASGSQGTLIGTTYTTAPITLTFTTTATNRFIGWAYANVNNLGGHTIDEILGSIQVERGSQATPYASYITPIELAKIGTYQDYIWNDDGVWKIHKEVGKVVLDGTNAGITWQVTQLSGSYCFWFRNDMISDMLNERHEKICDNFTYSPLAFNGGAPTPSLCENQYNSIILTLFKTDGSQGTTVADWQTWLGTHNTTVYYALATPTDTEITDDTLLAQLNTISGLYGGMNNISLVPSAGAQGTMEVKIHSIYERETEIYPQTAVRLTLTDDGIINPCGCRRNVQIKMRETIQ